MNKAEEKGCRIIINYLTDEEISTLLDKVAKKRMGSWPKKDAIQMIIQTDKAEQLLKRQQIKPESLFKYLQKLKIYPPANSTRKALIDMILKQWGKKDSEMLNVYPSAASTEKTLIDTDLKTLEKKDSEMPNVNPTAAFTEKTLIDTDLKTLEKKEMPNIDEYVDDDEEYNLLYPTLANQKEPNTKETSKKKDATKRPAPASDIMKIKKALYEKELILEDKRKAFLKAEAEMIKEQKKLVKAVTLYVEEKTNSSADK